MVRLISAMRACADAQPGSALIAFSNWATASSLFKVVYNGKLASLRRIDEDAKEVKAGFECGMTLENYQDIKEGDTMEFVEIELIKRKLGDT